VTHGFGGDEAEAGRDDETYQLQLDEENGEEVVPRLSEDDIAWRNEAEGRV
jgi:hypothetical protein